MRLLFFLRFLILLIFLPVLNQEAFAQSPVVLPPFGHTAFAADFDIDADSKTIASVGIDGHLILWDIATQKAFKKIKAHDAESYSVRYSWNGAYIITSSVDASVKVWTKDGHLLHTITTPNSNLYAELDRTEKFLSVACANGHAYVYEFPSLKLVCDITAGTTKANCAVFSTNSRLLFVGNDAGVLQAFDLEHEQKSLLNLPLETAVKMVSFDWAGSAMIIHTMNGMGEVLLLPSFKSLGRLPIPTVDYKSGAAAFVSNMDISPDSRFLAFANSNGQVQFVSGEALVAAAAKPGTQFETTSVPLPHKQFISKVKFSPDMRYVVTLGHDKQMCAIEIKNLELNKVNGQFVGVKVIKQYSDYIRSIYFDEEKNIHMRGFHTYTWNLKTGDHYTENISSARDKFLKQELKKTIAGKTEVYYDANRDIVLMNVKEQLKDPDEIWWCKDRRAALVQWNGKIWQLDVKAGTFKELYSLPWKDKPVYVVCTSAGEMAFASGAEVAFLSASGKKLWSLTAEGKVCSMDISFDNAQIAVGHYGKSLPVYAVKDGKLIKSVQTQEAEAQTVCFAADNKNVFFTGFLGGIGILNVATGSKSPLIAETEKNINAMAVSADGKMLATIGYDRLIRLYNVETKKALYDIFDMYESGMAVVNKNNFYMSDKKAYHELAFMYKDKIYTGDQFDAQFNRPDLVLAESPYADMEYAGMLSAAWKKRMKRMGINAEVQNQSTASISLVNQKEIKSNLKEKQIKLRIKITDSLHDVNRIMVSLNDVPVYGREGLGIKHLAVQKNSSLDLDIPLLPDKNIIKISAVDTKGSVSLPELVELNCFNEEKSQLYMVMLGTSKYKDSRFNLNFAAKDAGDMEALFKRDTSFAKVNTLLLTDEQVTVKSLEQVKTFLKQAGPLDVVMVFVAGHGLLDKDLNYYLAANETDFLNPAKGGIRYEDLENLFDGVASLRKTLLLDACHSGELDKEDVVATVASATQKDDHITFRTVGSGVLSNTANAKASLLSKELFADMRAGTGATVLSSAGGAEYAIESNEYKNGLFTYCVLEGIKSRTADLNGDGKIMLSELQDYVSKRVTEMSQGKQRPTSRSENLSMDFRVW